MEELDGVRLIQDFENLKSGTTGTIVCKYNDQNFEVEFFDDFHNTIDVYLISKDYLEVYWKYSEHKKINK